jgi:hypothetical protein
MAPTTLRGKLHPTRIRYGRDGKMAALVACILGESWTSPEIHALTVTSDGFVLGSEDGLANRFIGAFTSLQDNWARLLDFAKLTEDERDVADTLFFQATGRSAHAA